MFLIERERRILDIKEACYKKANEFIGDQVVPITWSRLEAALADQLSCFRDTGRLGDQVLEIAEVEIVKNDIDPTELGLRFFFGHKERHFQLDEPDR